MNLNEVFAACLFIPVLMATGLSDLRYMKIPNSYSLIGIAIFLLMIPILGFEIALVRMAVGGIAFLFCFALFAAGWLGGGDAKILPVTFLFVPYSILPTYLFSFAACMIVGMIAIWSTRRRYACQEAEWVSMRPTADFPMGISIAGSLPLALLLGATIT